MYHRSNDNIRKDVKVPDGVKSSKHHYYAAEVDSIYFAGQVIRGHPASGKAFQVTPSHMRLKGDEEGVVFAVEDTVAEKKDMAMPTISRRQEMDVVRKETARFYERPYSDVRIEQASRTTPSLVFTGGHGFLAAVLTSFARHLPLTLGPDEVWALVSFAFAQHVDKHAEVLRHHFVSHEGKKRLFVEVGPDFEPTGTPETGKPPEAWEEQVFPNFSEQIRSYIGKETHELIAGRFTTTSKIAQAAQEVTLMSTMKHYFSYGMTTYCGIPKVTLLGSKDDWTQLRVRAEELGNRMTEDFRDLWLPKLLPVLDQFVAAYQGDVHHGFWQSMVKMRHKSAFGSGESSEDYVTGWVQILYPYLKNGELNSSMRAWEDCYWSGPDTDSIPSTLSTAPVDWDGKDLHFHAGITGFTQDPADGALRPVLGWRVSHDPEKDPLIRIAKYKKEIEDLRKGMTGDCADHLGQSRICELKRSIRDLERQMGKGMRRLLEDEVNQHFYHFSELV